MSKRNMEEVMLVEHILEVRHSASGSFLDARGYVADYIRSQEIFSHWNIDANVVNFRDNETKIIRDGAFASYKSAGYIVYNPETRNYFADKASAYWKILYKNLHYTIPDLTRFGVRTKVFIPIKKPFEEIYSIVFDKFYKSEINEIIGGDIDDIQFVFNLKENKFNVRISGGPIHNNEAQNYMNFEAKELQECGIYLDIDYSKIDDLNQKDISKLLKECIDLTWIKIDNITQSLGI